MHDLFAVKYSWLIPLLPLIGAVISGFLGARWLKERSHWPIWITVGGSAVLSLMLLVGMMGQVPHGRGLEGVSVTRHIYTWIEAGSFSAEVGFFLDPLTAVMLCVVTGVGFLITMFSKGYMVGEEGYFRFFAYLGLFIFAMTVLVMADNFVLLYLGWEGVGLCSYLLIGYYYERPSAREAAKKAFLVNRIGDFGFSLGIMLIFVAFGTVSYFGRGPNTNTGVLEMAITTNVTPFQVSALGWIPFLLMLGAFGKSAQFPLYVWLPDAMEGPTPVSALIHAATMVTAGVYMIVRCGTLFIPNGLALLTIAAVGTFTAIFAAVIALRQFDLKKVLAYSTISQLGFMFAGAGLFAPVPAIFHLVTHAFFKALLFLSSGVVMHAMMGELDMRKMSGLKRVLPWTNRFMLIGCLALAGLPFLSGFLSKDEIIANVYFHSKLLGMVLLVTAFLTAYYSFRLYFRVFQGPLMVPAAPAHEEHGGGHHHHEPATMMMLLAVLALGAVFAGYLNWPDWPGHHQSLGEFLSNSPSILLSHELAGLTYGHNNLIAGAFGAEEIDKERLPSLARLHTNMMVASGLIALMGIYVAYLLHLKYRERGEELARRFPRISRVVEAKFWVDEVYQGGIVEPLRRLGRVCTGTDNQVVDGIIWAVGFVPQIIGFSLKVTTQRGSLQGYALLMLLAIAAILVIVFL
ncbi:MAG: NADH-quinone oxidoreductase subunit L [Planctomycetota bacterium]|nr:NADH-quinone oxidoreductase subunit L [Planctomycetota bacterium]